MHRRLTHGLAVLALIALITPAALAAPVPGTYTTTDLGGQLNNGRASVSRPTINSGDPKVLHAQDWNGSVLGTQWEIHCPVQATSTAPDVSGYNAGTGTGTIVYTQVFQGGEFRLFNTGGPWGFGVANLNTTTVISTVQLVNFQPVFSVVNANTSGSFGEGCSLTFGLTNGYGVGETTSLNPAITKPADYPTFLAPDCSPADAAHQFGTWGNTVTGVMQIDCVVPAIPTTWGSVKSRYH